MAVTIIVALFALIAGFLIGWFVEWRIDLAYWRTYFKEAEEAANEPPLTITASAPPQLLPSSQEILLDALKDQVAQRDGDLTALRATLDQLNAQAAAWRAREAELLDEIRQQRQQIEALAEARTEADTEWQLELRRREKDWEDAKNAEVARLQAELNNVRANTLAEARAEAARAEAHFQNQTAALHAQLAQLQTDLAALEKRFARYRATHPARLLDIPGITPQTQEDLLRAGILTYGDLAARTPEELRAILKPPHWRTFDFEAWIARARQLAAESE